MSLLAFTCHGIAKSGRLVAKTNNFNTNTKSYELIEVEKIIRERANNGEYSCKNVYFLTIFAFCQRNYEGDNHGLEIEVVKDDANER